MNRQCSSEAVSLPCGAAYEALDANAVGEMVSAASCRNESHRLLVLDGSRRNAHASTLVGVRSAFSKT
jgi:hypothetical protein